MISKWAFSDLLRLICSMCMLVVFAGVTCGGTGDRTGIRIGTDVAISAYYFCILEI